ncbi:MAG: arginine--tRNA ligase [Bacteroidia bacterium]|nr:arginine--tRNA ligase [Bacteroidia bacterium]
MTEADLKHINPKEILWASLNEILSDVNLSLKADDFPIQNTRKEFKGDLTLTLFKASKAVKLSPPELGQKIGEYLTKKFSEYFSEFEIVQGFLNISFSDDFRKRLLYEILQCENFGFVAVAENAPPVLLEYCSPNTNKPLHLGHLRNIFLGDAVSRILRACGKKVVTMNLVNDRGIHICKSMLMWMKDSRSKTPENTGIKGDFLVGDYYVQFDKLYKGQVEQLMAQGKNKEEAEQNAEAIREARELLRSWEKGDPTVLQDWKTMNKWVLDGFRQTLSRLNIAFDRWDFESNTYLEGKKAIEEGLQKNIFFRAPDGSVRVDLSSHGLDEKVLLRSDGTSVYITQDIGTALMRYRDYGNIEGMIYTVGNEQDYHFKVLFAILDKLGYSWASRCKHLSYGMVELPTGKMKSREGTVVDADDLLDEMFETAKEITTELGKTEGLSEEEKNELYEMIGQGALRYFILKVDPHKKIVFDPRESIDFNGHTGPFIQYTHARIRSVIRKSGYEKFDLPTDNTPMLNESEKHIINRLYSFPEILVECLQELNPAPLANHLYELSKEFNRFYHDHSILNEQNNALRHFRVCLTEACGRQIKKGMELLGIRVPERM